jgi:hypothetical protein
LAWNRSLLGNGDYTSGLVASEWPTTEWLAVFKPHESSGAKTMQQREQDWLASRKASGKCSSHKHRLPNCCVRQYSSVPSEVG